MVTHRIIIDAAGIHKQGIRTEDAELAERWAREAPANAQASGHITEPVVLHIDPMHGDEHGRELIGSVHRLHADIGRGADGTPQVRALYHYPERAADDDSAPHPKNPLLTKRQWVKIPQLATRAHRIIKGEK